VQLAHHTTQTGNTTVVIGYVKAKTLLQVLVKSVYEITSSHVVVLALLPADKQLHTS
jgi:hypothetical protein